MATTEPGISAPATTSEVGRHLRTVRKAKGLSRAEVARSAGLTRRELAAYERGRTPVPHSDLWCLAGSCGVDVNELLPPRDQLKVGSDLGSLTVGDSVRRLRAGTSSDGLLREYLAMIYELRNLPPGTRPPMREEDLAALADALGGSPEVIEARLIELVGASREEATRLRIMIMPPKSLGAAPSAVAPLPDLMAYAGAPTASVGASAAAPATEYGAFDFPSSTTTVGDPDATDRFFDGPRADDPFSAPPLSTLAPLDLSGVPPAASTSTPTPTPTPAPAPAPAPAAAGPPAPEPMPAPMPEPPSTPAHFDPFAPPSAAPIDPFGPPTGLPLAPPAAFDAPAFDPTEFDRTGFDPTGFDPTGFDPNAFDPPPFDPNTFDPAAFDPAAFDPAAFDPAAFDPNSFAGNGFDAGVAPAPFAFEPTASGAFDVGSVEMMSVGVDESGAAMDADPMAPPPIAPLLAPQPDPGWMASWEGVATGVDPDPGTDVGTDIGDDPLAVLRAPIDSELDPGAPSSDFDVPSAVEVDADPFASAFEPVDALEYLTRDTPDDAAAVPDLAASDLASPVLATDADGDPADEWFDRAAAATEALIADHQQSTGILSVEPAFDVTGADVPVADTHVADGAAPDDDADNDADNDAVATPAVALERIAWSLHPPAPSPTVPVDWDAIASSASAAPPVVLDSQFVAAGTNWQVGGMFPATAMADDGTLALRRADLRWALADLEAADDFTVRATVDFTSGAGFGILFRVSVDDSERITGYSFDVDPVYSGGGFLLRQWDDNRQHWKPLAHAPVADPSRLYGRHTIEVTLHADQLTATADGETVLTMRQLSRCSIESGREPCRGGRLGIQAWSTTEITVDRLLLANH